MKFTETCSCGARLDLEFNLAESVAATVLVERFHHEHRGHEPRPPRWSNHRQMALPRALPGA